MKVEIDHKRRVFWVEDSSKLSVNPNFTDTWGYVMGCDNLVPSHAWINPRSKVFSVISHIARLIQRWAKHMKSWSGSKIKNILDSWALTRKRSPCLCWNPLARWRGDEVVHLCLKVVTHRFNFEIETIMRREITFIFHAFNMRVCV